MHGTLKTGLKYENVKWSSGRACSLQFKVEWKPGLQQYVGDLQQCFYLPLTIILLFSLTFKSPKQLSTPPSDVLARAGDKQ